MIYKFDVIGVIFRRETKIIGNIQNGNQSFGGRTGGGEIAEILDVVGIFFLFLFGGLRQYL